MAEHDPADRARDEAQRIGGEGEQGADQRLELGKEQLVEDQRRSRTVEEDSVPFDRGADQARSDNPSQRCLAILRRNRRVVNAPSSRRRITRFRFSVMSSFPTRWPSRASPESLTPHSPTSY